MKSNSQADKAEYKRLDKAVKRMYRADEQTWVDKKAGEEEEAGARKDTENCIRYSMELLGSSSSEEQKRKGVENEGRARQTLGRGFPGSS